MQNNILIQEMNRYNCKNIDEIKNAFREVGQKIVLSGLARGGIFEHTVFYGGTSLRLLYNLDRFSEDLDFTLIHQVDGLPFEAYLSSAVNELRVYGLDSIYTIKNKSIETSVITGYIKFNLADSIERIYSNQSFKVNKEENISIKIEIETKFFPGYKLEYRTLLFPAYFKVQTFNLESLFSCKLLAVLKRNWKNRVKGRDYFDFLFYVTNQVTPNYELLANGLGLSSINRNELLLLLKEKFESIDFNSALNDILPFVDANSRFIRLFHKDIFIDISNEIKEETV